MKVFLLVIAGIVPDKMVQALSAFLESCYLIHCSQVDEDILLKINAVIKCFHDKREIFIKCNIRTDFNLPC